MDKHETISAIKFIYQKVKDDFVIRRKFPTHEVESALDDYGNLIVVLETNDWHTFGKETLNKIGAIQGKYFGKGEFLNGFCPKIITYQESLAAQRALDSISELIRTKNDQNTDN